VVIGQTGEHSRPRNTYRGASLSRRTKQPEAGGREFTGDEGAVNKDILVIGAAVANLQVKPHNWISQWSKEAGPTPVILSSSPRVLLSVR
jgi:hypothetical protein